MRRACVFRAKPARDFDAKAATPSEVKGATLRRGGRPLWGGRRKGGRHPVGRVAGLPSERTARRAPTLWHSRPLQGEGRAMPARRLSMRKVQEVLRLLVVCGLSQRAGGRGGGGGG